MNWPPFRVLPTFTTVDSLWHRQLNRWMTGTEKLQALGFPIKPTVANAYNVESRLNCSPQSCYVSTVGPCCGVNRICFFFYTRLYRQFGTVNAQHKKTKDVMEHGAWPKLHQRCGKSQHLPQAETWLNHASQ